METTANIIKLILLSVIAVALVVIMVFLINGKSIKFKTSNAELIHDKSYTEEVKNIKVESTSTDIEVVENDKNEINVKVYDEKEQKDVVSVKVENDTLEIYDKKKNNFHFFNIGFIGKGPRIIISIPKDTKYNLDFETTSGDINVEKNMNNVNIHVTSGDISLKNALDTKIKSTSGDIELGEVSNLNIHTTSGDVKAKKVNTKVNIELTSGDITINEVNLSKNSSIKAVSGDITIDKTNDIYIESNTTSGDEDVFDSNRKATTELKIKTTSGDIEVNK